MKRKREPGHIDLGFTSPQGNPFQARVSPNVSQATIDALGAVVDAVAQYDRQQKLLREGESGYFAQFRGDEEVKSEPFR